MNCCTIVFTEEDIFCVFPYTVMRIFMEILLLHLTFSRNGCKSFTYDLGYNVG